MRATKAAPDADPVEKGAVTPTVIAKALGLKKPPIGNDIRAKAKRGIATFWTYDRVLDGAVQMYYDAQWKRCDKVYRQRKNTNQGRQ